MAMHKIKEGTVEWEAMKQREKRALEREKQVNTGSVDAGFPTARAIAASNELVQLADTIHKSALQFALKLQVFRDQDLYRALGYDSMKAYITEVLHMSDRRVYQLLSFAEVRAELLEAIGPDAEEITERQVRELKRLPPEERVAVVKAFDLPTATAKEVRQAVAAKIAPAPAPVGAPIGRLRGLVTAKPEPAVIAEAEVDEAAIVSATDEAAREDAEIARDEVYPDTQPNEWPNRAPVVEHITVVRVPQLQPGAPDPLVRIARADDPERLYPCPHCGTLMRVAEFIGAE